MDILKAVHLASPWQQVGLAAVSVTAAYAFVAGGRAERIGAGLMLAGWLLTPFLLDLSPRPFDPYAILLIDAAMLGAFTALALTSDRYWPMAFAAFLLLGAVLHLAQMIDPQVALRQRIAATHIFSYLTLVALAVGVFIEARVVPRATRPAGRL